MRRLFIGFGLLCLLTPLAHADPLVGRVVAVHDGDTLTLLTLGNRSEHIRLASIDAPEIGQPGGYQAKQALSSLVYGRVVSVDEDGDSSYGRPIGTIYVNQVNVNEEMVREGEAWVYTRYNQDSAMPGLQASAQAARVGVWALQPDQQIAPWDWRHHSRH